MRYNIQNVIRRLQEFQKKYPEMELVDEDVFLAISTKKIYQLDNEKSIIKRLQNEVERIDIENERIMKQIEKDVVKEENDRINHINSIRRSVNDQLPDEKPDKDRIKYLIEMKMKSNTFTPYKCNMTKTAEKLIISRKTLREWVKDGIIYDIDNNERYCHWKGISVDYSIPDEMNVDLNVLLTTLKTAQKRMTTLRNVTKKKQ